MSKPVRIGTRDSQLAVWQATLVQDELKKHGIASELVYIKSDGDIDLITPLYEMGVQGVFTKTLDAALLGNRIDIAVHSMKDVPTQLAQGLAQAAVLERASYLDVLVFKEEKSGVWSPRYRGEESGVTSSVKANHYLLHTTHHSPFIIHHSLVRTPDSRPQTPNLLLATSSVRRKAQWLHRYPHHRIENLRGNVNTRLQKVQDNDWDGAIFAAAGLERIGLRPSGAIDLDWMLPAPTQGIIMIACRENDADALNICAPLNNEATAICAQLEKDFLRQLMGGCATPISALAEWKDGNIVFRGSILSLNGEEKIEIEGEIPANEAAGAGIRAAQLLMENGAGDIINAIRNAGL